MSHEPLFDERSLAGLEVAISVSEPDPGELAARGVSKVHVDHAFLEIVRQVLAASGTVAYGGDLRESGYTENLLAFLNRYADGARPDKERVRQYLAWPIWEQTDVQARSGLNALVSVVNVPAPAGEGFDPKTFDLTTSPATRAYGAESFTQMRTRMTESMAARVILGGRLTSHKSRFPGVVEEAFLAARQNKPLFVLGGFGGCASCLAQVMRGERPQALTLDYQLEHTDGYSELVEGLDSVVWEPVLDTIAGHSQPNGLSREENDRLLDTADLEEVVFLVLRGLRQLATNGQDRTRNRS